MNVYDWFPYLCLPWIPAKRARELACDLNLTNNGLSSVTETLSLFDGVKYPLKHDLLAGVLRQVEQIEATLNN